QGKMRLFLLQCAEKFQSKEPQFACGILSQHLRRYRGSLGRDGAGWRGRGSGNGQIYDLVGPKYMSRSDTCSCCTDIERLRKLDEFNSRGVRAPNEHGYLDLDSRRASRGKVVQALPYLRKLGIHDDVVS